MSNVASIGERLYRRVVEPVWSDDRRRYSAGCIVRGEGGAVKVIFLQYEIGRGIVGRCKPSAEMAGWLKQYGHELKEYIRGKMNASVKDWAGKSTRSKILSIRPDDRSKILPCRPPSGGRF